MTDDQPPVRRGNGPIVAAIVVLGAVAVGSFGYVLLAGDDGDDGAGGRVEVRADVTVADLEPALLTAADVPDGFTEVPWEDDDGDALGPDDVDASPACEHALARFGLSDDAREEVGAEFEAGDGATISHTLSPAVADDVTLGDVAGAIDSCGTFGFDDGTDAGEMTMTAEPVDGIGDQALAVTAVVRTEAEGVPVTVEVHGILADRSGVHSSVGFSGGFDLAALAAGRAVESRPIDRAAVRRAAEAADARVEAVLAG